MLGFRQRSRMNSGGNWRPIYHIEPQILRHLEFGWRLAETRPLNDCGILPQRLYAPPRRLFVAVRVVPKPVATANLMEDDHIRLFLLGGKRGWHLFRRRHHLLDDLLLLASLLLPVAPIPAFALHRPPAVGVGPGCLPLLGRLAPILLDSHFRLRANHRCLHRLQAVLHHPRNRKIDHLTHVLRDRQDREPILLLRSVCPRLHEDHRADFRPPVLSPLDGLVRLLDIENRPMQDHLSAAFYLHRPEPVECGRVRRGFP